MKQTPLYEFDQSSVGRYSRIGCSRTEAELLIASQVIGAIVEMNGNSSRALAACFPDRDVADLTVGELMRALVP